MAKPERVNCPGDQPEFRIGGKQPGNLYRNNERFGFVLRDEDGPLVAAALNAFVDGGRPRGEPDSETPQSTDDLRERLSWVLPSEFADHAMDFFAPLLAAKDAKLDRYQGSLRQIARRYREEIDWRLRAEHERDGARAQVAAKDTEIERWKRAWQGADREWAKDRALGQWLVAEARSRVAELSRERDEARQSYELKVQDFARETSRVSRALAACDRAINSAAWNACPIGEAGLGWRAAQEYIEAAIRADPESGRPVAQEAGEPHEHEWTRCPTCPRPAEPCACSGVPCCDAQRAEDAAEADEHYRARVARVWQKGDPEPADRRLILRDSQGDEWGRVREGWMLLKLDGAVPSPKIADVGPHRWKTVGQFAPLTEVLEDDGPPSDQPKVPPGPYAKGGRSPIVWVLLCPVCAGYAPITAEDYQGALSGQCQGCGALVRELHRFRAWIDSASGCHCSSSHQQVVGDVRVIEDGDSPLRCAEETEPGQPCNAVLDDGFCPDHGEVG